MTIFERLAIILRRFPFLLIIPYQVYKLFQARFYIGVVAVVINEQHQVLLAEHVFHAKHPWGLPGGWVDRGEEPATAIIRELHEELDLTVDDIQLLVIRATHQDHLDIAYLCTTTQNTMSKLSFELTGYDWYEMDNLPQLHTFHQYAIQSAQEQLLNEEISQ